MHRYATLLVLVLLVGCGGGGGGGGGPGGGGETFGLESRTVVSGLTFPTGVPNPGALDPENAFDRLTFDRPLFLTFPTDGSDRIFVVEQDGRILVFENDPDTSSKKTFLDISSAVSRAGNEEGLLGLAFHPSYASNGQFYVYYSMAGPRRSRLSRFTVSAGDPDAADPTSETVLLEIPEPYSNHNGGCLAFGPDGKLYVAVGDGGSSGDPQNNAQRLDTLLGKVLRLEPDGSAPSDNPFVGQSGARGEIWAYGLRNPWRLSFDRNDGTLWVGDVGQGTVEEIDVVVRGGNYGWRFYEGDRAFNNPANRPATDFVAPVVTYGRSLGQSVTGGYVYRGPTLTSVRGAYLYADFASGRVWALVRSGGQVVSNVEVARVSSPSSFGEDRDGELYVTSFDGRIYRFRESGGAPTQFPEKLSGTGLFTDTAGLTAAPGVLEYEVNAPFWSDGARKRRWIALPGTSRITFSATGPWALPTGTILVKHFEIDLAAGGTERLETRVLVHHDSGWQGYTYRWNDAQTDADLLDGTESEIVRVPDGAGTLDLTWTYPSRGDCLACHTVAAGRVLGVSTRQLNRDFPFAARTDNQLRAWSHIGLFDRSIGDPGDHEALADPADDAFPLADRVRGWLDTNCAGCHLPNGPTPVNLDLRAGIPATQMNAVGVPPTTGVGAPGSLRITRFEKEKSSLWELVRRLGGGRMPPIGSHRVDTEGTDLLGSWIDSGAD